MNDPLAQFLRDAAGREFKLGEWDCGIFLRSWYTLATGRPDPGAHLRGVEYGATDLIRYMITIMRASGFRRTREPKRGDIGIVRLGNLAHGVICTGTRWIMVSEGAGMSALPVQAVRVIAAWRVPLDAPS